MTNEAPVWVYYKNIATQETLLEPHRLDGNIGESYTINTPDLTNYKYVDNSGELSGVFGNMPQSLQIFYQPASWQAVHRVTMYIHMKNVVVSYAAPDDYNHVTANLTNDSYWATPLRVITGNGQFWYQIGDHNWVPYDITLMTLSDTAPNIENINYIKDAELENDQPNAIVNFLPEQSTEVFESPYGLPIGSVLDGDFVAITTEQHDKNHLVWYKLAHHGWINSIYIDKI